MKNISNVIVLSLLFIIVLSCKENQIADDSPCPNCPVVLNVTPSLAQEGNEVTISGQRFGNDKSRVTVEIQTTPQKVTLTATDINSLSDTEIKFKVPAGKQGAGKVVVKVNIGTDILASDDAGINPKPADILFSFKGKASITNTTALSGRVGETVSILGLNFGAKKEDIKIKIGTFDIPAGNISSVTETDIKFTLPPKVPESGAVALTVAGFAVSGTLTFQYNLPKITTTALTGAKDAVVDIAGDNFGTTAADVKVTVGTTNVTVQSVTNTLLKVKIPKGLANGKTMVKILDYESKEKPEFLYKWTATVATLRTTTESGTWVIDPVDESIYFVTIVGTSLTIKKYNLQTKVLDAFNSQAVTSQSYNLSLSIAYSGMLFIPYTTLSQPSFNRLLQIGLEKTLAAIYNGKQALGNVGQSGTVNVPTNLQSLTGTNSLGIENRQNMFMGFGQQFYRITTDQSSWTSPFTTATLLGQVSAIAPVMYADNKVYIPIAGGMMVYDAVANKLNPFVGTTTAMQYTSTAVQGDGVALSARFSNPYSITKSPNESFFITDTGNSLIRMVSKNSDGQYIVSTIAGIVGSPGSDDGVNAKVQTPRAIHYSSIVTKGNIFFIDNNNKSLRSIILD